MVLPISPGAISLANLQLEYGGQVPISLSEFYGFGNGPSTSTRQIDLGRFRQQGSSGGIPNPITDGLLFNFDAKDFNSYPGTGSTWNDISGNARNMSLIGSPTFIESQAINFAGTLTPLQYAEIANNTWIPQGTSPRTYECYVRMNAWVPAQAGATISFLWSKTSPNNQACSFGFNVSTFNSNGIVNLILGTQGGGNFSEATDSYTLPNPATYLGSYHHYAFTYDGSIAKMYIDGSLVFTSASGKQFHTNTAQMRWMIFDPTNANFRWPVNATMRGARLYNRALSDIEMANNYASWGSGSQGVVNPSLSNINLGGASTTVHTGIAFTSTFTFNVPVFGFNANKINLTNANKGSFTGAGGTTTYSLQIIPTGGQTITLGIASTASFNAGNVGNNPVNASYQYVAPSSGLTPSLLVVNLSARDSSSYPGTGTTWTNVGLGTTNPSYYNVTLSDATFNSANPKSFTLAGGSSMTIPRPISSDFTISCWFKTTQVAGNGANQWWEGNGLLDAEVGGSTTDYGITIGQGIVMFGVGAPDTTIRSTSTVNTGNWVYVVATREKSTGNMKLYVNGTLEASTTSSQTGDLIAVPNLQIGNGSNGGYVGSIGDIQVWNSVLSQNDIDNNYANGRSYYV